MSANLDRLRSSRPIYWRTLFGLVLVPLTVAGVLLWGLWNPTERLETVTAAVVNLDEPVTVDGQMIPMGRVLAAELIGGDADTNFTWLLTDESDAEAGLEDGRYATVVTIPENFSAAATSASRGAGEAESATIGIQTSDRGRLLDSALSSIVTTTATSVLNEQLGAQFVGNIFVGMTELGAGIGTAADGASELADGLSQLADGTAQLSTGTQQLATGANELASGARAAATGGAQLAGGVENYVAGVNQVLGAVQTASPQLVAQLQSLRALIENDVIAPPADLTKQEALDGIDALIGAMGGIGSQVDEMIAGGTQLAGGVRASANGQAQLAAGIEQYAAGVNQLAAGTPELADGARQAAEGTVELADGLQTAADGIPSYTEAESERMADAMVRPVVAEGTSDELFNAAGVPLFAGIALWAGALASGLVLSPLWRRTRIAARGVGFITLRSALPAAGIGAAQGAIAGAVLPPLLGYDWGQGLSFFALAVTAGIAFSLVNQGLSALLGGFGRFLSFALLVVAFAIGVISTAPPLLQAIGDASPVGALFSGFQSVATSGAGVGGSVGLLVVWAAGGLVLTAFAVARARKAGSL